MPHLLLTPGDPTGIGPEITVKALQRLGELPPLQLTVIGSIAALEKAATSLSLRLPAADTIAYENIEAEQPGAVAYLAIERAVEKIAHKKGDVLVTGPISKRNLAAAGYAYAGHTEILEHLAHHYFLQKEARAEMLFVYKNLRLLLLTRHLALKDVPAALAETGAVARPIKSLIAYLRHQVKIDEPRLAMLGLNPHAGEVGGGEEEKKYFLPVINAVNAIGASRIEGPFPADAFFRSFASSPSMSIGEKKSLPPWGEDGWGIHPSIDIPYDAIIAAYHDQGLIPFKMLAGYEAVNVTIGLPFLRTSVSHGTAEDIAGQGIAREDSLMAALRAAL